MTEHCLSFGFDFYRRAFELKTSLTEEPRNPEEEAVLLIERAKDTHNPAIRRDYLVKCVQCSCFVCDAARHCVFGTARQHANAADSRLRGDARLLPSYL